MKYAPLVLLLALASPALAQEGDTTTGKAIPQEEAMTSCTTQSEKQQLPSDEQKKQFMMACLTGVVGSGPAPRRAPPEQQQKVCTQQADYLRLASGERDNFLTACVKRNDNIKQP